VVSGLRSNNLATIYFYRTNNSFGSAVGVDIEDNGIDVGTLQDGTYFIWHTNPWQHALTATTNTAWTENFELRAGAIVPSQHLFQPSLSVVFELQGQSAIQDLQLLSYNE
jgi:hypothetical protein